jgi:Regulator of G protein signaling domain
LLAENFHSFLVIQGLYSQASPKDEVPVVNHSNEPSTHEEILIVVSANENDSDSIRRNSTTESRRSGSTTTIVKSNIVATLKGKAGGQVNDKPISKSPSESSVQAKASAADITIDSVLANLTVAPYSQKNYRAFLQISMSEENLDFLVDVLAYQKFAARFYPQPCLLTKTLDMFESCNQLCPITKPPAIDDLFFETETNNLKNSILQIANTYLKSQSEKEVNISSKIMKPLMMLIETGYYNPEIFLEAYSHIRHMLVQNGFDNFIKSAASGSGSVDASDGIAGRKNYLPNSGSVGGGGIDLAKIAADMRLQSEESSNYSINT